MITAFAATIYIYFITMIHLFASHLFNSIYYCICYFLFSDYCYAATRTTATVNVFDPASRLAFVTAAANINARVPLGSCSSTSPAIQQHHTT